MAYPGKYIDRLPFIKAAGDPYIRTEGVEDSIPRYTEAELAEIIHKSKISEKKKEILKPKILPRTPKIIDNDFGDILTPDLNKSRFVTFREKFAENLFFKKPELGKVFPWETKPIHVDEYFTNGKPNYKHGPVYDLVFPKKKQANVNRDYAKFHDKYLISHGHYFPSERINRRYNPEFFNENHTFGKKYNANFSGLGAKRALTQEPDKPLINESHARFLRLNRPEVGIPLKKWVHTLPPQGYFGHKVKSPGEEHHVKEILENTEYEESEYLLRDSYIYIQKIRRKLSEFWEFYYYDLRTAFERHDPERTGYLPWEIVFQIAHKLFIRLDPDKCKMIAKEFGYVNEAETCVKYYKFLKLLNLRNELPIKMHTKAVLYGQDSTYREFSKDFIASQYCEDLRRQSLSKFTVVIPTKLREIEGVVKDLLPPTFTPHQLGIHPKQYYMLRTKDQIREIFKHMEFNDQLFDIIWGEALRLPSTLGERVSIDAFLYAMRVL